ncbi:MAG: TIGR03643 family protein [Leptolyngbya sp. SIOISBB]|nr:TIGR03643 family protein [Leptolyngbya sp. SIOISBB]
MAWDNWTPFDAIELQFGLREKDVITLMRREMKPSNFRTWGQRFSGRSIKHRQQRRFLAGRFCSANQQGS